MKNLISVAITSLMVANVFFVGQTQIVDTQPIEETEEVEEVHILTDEELSLLYSYHEDVRKTDDSIVEVSYEDAQLLMKLGKCEDFTDAKSQAYIMSVVFNRKDSEDFPDSIYEIIHQESQFSCVDDGRFAKAEPDLNSHLALAMIESGQIKTDFMYFEASSLENSWQFSHRKVACVYGGTRFYY